MTNVSAEFTNIKIDEASHNVQCEIILKLKHFEVVFIFEKDLLVWKRLILFEKLVLIWFRLEKFHSKIQSEFVYLSVEWFFCVFVTQIQNKSFSQTIKFYRKNEKLILKRPTISQNCQMKWKIVFKIVFKSIFDPWWQPITINI